MAPLEADVSVETGVRLVTSELLVSDTLSDCMGSSNDCAFFGAGNSVDANTAFVAAALLEATTLLGAGDPFDEGNPFDASVSLDTSALWDIVAPFGVCGIVDFDNPFNEEDLLDVPTSLDDGELFGNGVSFEEGNPFDDGVSLDKGASLDNVTKDAEAKDCREMVFETEIPLEGIWVAEACKESMFGSGVSFDDKV